MKTIFLVFVFLSQTIYAQTTYYSDSMGLPLGTANRVGNTTFYSNAMGLPLGSAQTPQTVAPIKNYTPSYATPPAPLFPTSPRGM